MYGLSSRDSLSRTQTRWVQAVEETTKVIHLPVAKPSSESLHHLESKVTELEKLCYVLEERIIALESRSCPPEEVESVLPDEEDHLTQE